MKSLRVAFLGSPAFAVPSLTRLLEDGHTLALVLTQPDRPAGRGQALRPPPVKSAAQKHRLPLLQPERLNDPTVLSALADAQPDVIAVTAFGQFLPRAVRAPEARMCERARLLAPEVSRRGANQLGADQGRS